MRLWHPVLSAYNVGVTKLHGSKISRRQIQSALAHQVGGSPPSCSHPNWGIYLGLRCLINSGLASTDNGAGREFGLTGICAHVRWAAPRPRFTRSPPPVTGAHCSHPPGAEATQTQTQRLGRYNPCLPGAGLHVDFMWDPLWHPEMTPDTCDEAAKQCYRLTCLYTALSHCDTLYPIGLNPTLAACIMSGFHQNHLLKMHHEHNHSQAVL